MKDRLMLITGASGKVGRHFLATALEDRALRDFTFRALCHQRPLEARKRLEVVTGSISDLASVRAAMDGVTHVLHLATCKETPEAVIDVTVKGLFWLLEEARTSDVFQQFILIGGDASIGHFFYPRNEPVTEAQPHQAYPGCYALSKVLEEVMLDQYYHQYDINGCCLRAPWIMEKDDFKYQLSFGEDVFGGPRWCDFVSPEEASDYQSKHTVPVMLDPEGHPVKRNFVHVSDLVRAIIAVVDHAAARQQLFNICMDAPVDYRLLADHLKRTRNYPSITIKTPYHSTWLDNTKAKHLLGWQPEYDLARLTDEAFGYQRAQGDPRIIYYPG